MRAGMPPVPIEHRPSPWRYGARIVMTLAGSVFACLRQAGIEARHFVID